MLPQLAKVTKNFPQCRLIASLLSLRGGASAIEAGGVRFADRITIAGQVRGSDIAGRNFYDALLKIWLGGKPVQAELKSRLLGR